MAEGKIVPEMEVLPAVRSNVEAMTRGEIDIQISTAKAYPRSIEQFRKKALGMATIDEETAASCYFKLPRDGKTIEGPSVRLAEIVASAYGNLRVQGRVVSEDERNVTLSGGAWDIENNVLYSVEVRRRITKKDGGRYSDDMINTTANAGISIAVRNALFRAVPHTYTKEILEECKKVARGSAATLGTRRLKALEWFASQGIDAKRVFAGIGVRGVEDITIEHLETLQGVRTAIREGELRPEDAFNEPMAQASSTADPVAQVMGDLGVTEAEADWFLKAWAALKTPPAGRIVQMKQYAGKGADLRALLETMLPEQGTAEQPARRKPGRPAKAVVDVAIVPADDKAENAQIDAAIAAKEQAGAAEKKPAAKGSGFNF